MAAGGELTVTSLFTGVAGLDEGLARAGLDVVEMCESWAPARRVLAAHRPDVPVHDDVVGFVPRRRSRVLVAGFPCTNISHAGDRSGIGGVASGLVDHVFRIASVRAPEWIVLENVPNLLGLHRGAGMRHITGELEALGYRWAYRTVDSRFTGVPQRRPRVVILAARRHDPAEALLRDDAGTQPTVESPSAWGFYWTEGRHGVGLVADAVPTLKGGSTLGLASAPAVWLPGQPSGMRFVIPSIEQGERLQGLPPGWTAAATRPGEPDMRWKLVGNAVTVGVGRWIGDRIAAGVASDAEWDGRGEVIDRQRKWPDAGWGGGGSAFASTVSRWPVVSPYTHLADVVDPASAKPLSHRATTGFLSRVAESGLVPIDTELYRDLEDHQAATRPILNRSARQRAHASAEPGSWASNTKTRRRMQATGPRDTKPEMRLRRALTALGLRYRLQVRPESDLRWRMDVVFGPSKVAVDVRGCFWHVCPLHATKPKANADRWSDKLAGNVARDARVVEALSERGWHVEVVWEHEDAGEAADRIAAIVARRRPTSAPRGLRP